MSERGRPVGSTTRPQIRQFISWEDIKELTELAVAKAKAGDAIMHKFVLEQIYGKAAQVITGEDGGAVKIEIVKYAGDTNSLQLGAGEASAPDTGEPGEVQGDSLASQGT